MKKRIYWKNIRQSLLSSKGRFFSIFHLMLIGSMALVGLKAAAPNMEKTAQEYIDQGQMVDVAVMSDFGISQADKAELDGITGARIEYAYFKDVTMGTGTEAIRLFSIPKTISRYQLKRGEAPASANEILLSSNLEATYHIGDKIAVKEGNKQASVLKETEFTVTGFADSSEIWGKINLGPASTGTGQLAAYAFVAEEAFDSEVYMMARIRYDDTAFLPYYQAEYKQSILAHQEKLNQLLVDNGKERLASIHKDSQGQLEDAKRKLQTAQQQLEEAQSNLATNEAALQQAQQQLQQGQEELEVRANTLDVAWEELHKAKEELDISRSQLDVVQKELEIKRYQLESSREELLQAEVKLVASQDLLNEKETALDQTATWIAQAQSDIQTARKVLQDQQTFARASGENPDEIPELIELYHRLKQKEEEVHAEQQAYQSGVTSYRASQIEYEESQARYQVGKQQYEEGVHQYQIVLTVYQEGEVAYQDGLAEYESDRVAYETGQRQLEEVQASLAEEQSKLDQGKRELQKGKKDLESKREEVEPQLIAAQKKVQIAQAELAQLDTPEYKSYTRDSLPGGNGYANYDSSTKSISAVGTIFPTVLYIVAALVTFMTMSRFVDEERGNIGIFKALGYTNRQIINRFVFYGSVSGLAGTIVGSCLGNFFLAPMISRIITETTIIGESHVYIYPKWIALAMLFALFSSVLPAYLVARRELKEQPARLLQPKPPVSGARIFLEHLSFIWQRLTFTQKVTARNIFRYKKRMLMTLFGVAGTVALLFAGLGIRSSISRVIDQQFGQLLHYQLVVVEQSRASKEEKEKVTASLQSRDITQALPVAYYSLTELLEGQQEALAISLFVSQEKDLSSFVTLRNPLTGHSLELPEKGAILSEKLAQMYQVEIGDTVVIKMDQEPIEIQVAGIAEMYAGHFIYLSASAYQEATGKPYQPNASLLVLTSDEKQAVEKVATDFLAMKGVVAVVQNTSLITLLETIVQSLQSVMIILIVLSVLLGMVILYNLTTINIAERIRELSTIKVLGFYDKEVTFYIYRETMLLSIVGIVLGLLAGYFLHRILLIVIASPTILFSTKVSIDVYLVPIGAIISILAILGWHTHRYLSKVEMLKALKSGE